MKRYQLLVVASAEAEGMQLVQLLALLGCSNGFRRLGDYDASREAASRARMLAKALGDRSREAKSLMLIGSAERQRLQAQAEAMSQDELAGYALDALKHVKD